MAHTLCYRSTAGILGSSIASAIIIVRSTPSHMIRMICSAVHLLFWFRTCLSSGTRTAGLYGIGLSSLSNKLERFAARTWPHIVPQVDVKNGRRLLVDLEVPYPPFFLQWSDCGTRLAMLSNWNHMQCAAVPSCEAGSPSSLPTPALMTL